MKYILPTILVVACTSCSSMLPTKTIQTHTQWSEYGQLEIVAGNIRAGQTLSDLKGRGIDVNSTKNVEVLTHLDVAKKFGLIGMKDDNLKTPRGVQRMMDAAERGRGYELTVENISSAREGSFWKDFLNFRRTTRETGWKYNILIITVDDKVEYVLHKGNPNINRVTVEKNPLGPFQKLNGYVLVDLAEELIE